MIHKKNLSVNIGVVSIDIFKEANDVLHVLEISDRDGERTSVGN